MLLKHLNNDPGPHLIVCPASVLENWERELKKWCPSFSVLQYHGAGRTAYSRELSSLAKAGLPPPFNVLLVCYSLFERHRFVYCGACNICIFHCMLSLILIIDGLYSVQQKDDRKILKRWRWSCVLMDEAHALKDKNSYRWKNLMSVARNANQRLMLTGTPLQNDLHVLLLFSFSFSLSLSFLLFIFSVNIVYYRNYLCAFWQDDGSYFEIVKICPWSDMMF